jgi:penicillin amidase
MQLSAPGVNVYGVSIPGTPAVIIGFNNKVAWGITNGADDVKDWYKLKIKADIRSMKWMANGSTCLIK